MADRTKRETWMSRVPTPRAWYRLFLIALLGLFLVWRLPELVGGIVTIVDFLVGVVWLALMLAPLFAEVNLLGLKFRATVDEAVHDVKREIATARSELAAAITVQASVRQDFHFGPETGSVPAELGGNPNALVAGAARSGMEYKILNTLWTKQVNKFPDLAQRFTFRLHANRSEFVEWRLDASKLFGEGFVGEADNGQIFLTHEGFEYCKAHHGEFPPEQWWPEEPINQENLLQVMGPE